MIVTTTESVPGNKIKEYKGLVWSSTARSRHIGGDLNALVKSLVGGEIGSYRKLVNEGRDYVVKGLVENGKKIRADAIIAVKFGSTQIVPGTLDFYAYGTAVTLEKEGKGKR